MKDKHLKSIDQVKSQLDAICENSEDKIFALFVFNELEKGISDIACHPKSSTGAGIYDYEFVDANDIFDNPIYSHQRKICHKIGELILDCHTTRIYGKCGLLIGCKNKKWGGDGKTCQCEYGVPNNFIKFRCDHYVEM